MNSLLRHSFVVGGVVGLIVIVLIVGALRPKHASGAGTAAPPVVMVAEVEQRDVDLYTEWIGTLAGEVNANVQAQVTGYLRRRDYQEGSSVRKGQLLFEIDLGAILAGMPCCLPRPETSAEEKWTLQGQLVGLWVSEMRKTWKKAHRTDSNLKCIVDLNDVTSIDRKGEGLLRAMSKQGVQFIASGIYIKHLLQH